MASKRKAVRMRRVPSGNRTGSLWGSRRKYLPGNILVADSSHAHRVQVRSNRVVEEASKRVLHKEPRKRFGADLIWTILQLIGEKL